MALSEAAQTLTRKLVAQGCAGPEEAETQGPKVTKVPRQFRGKKTNLYLAPCPVMFPGGNLMQITAGEGVAGLTPTCA